MLRLLEPYLIIFMEWSSPILILNYILSLVFVVRSFGHFTSHPSWSTAKELLACILSLKVLITALFILTLIDIDIDQMHTYNTNF